jgi:arsenate reductase (thioredoxin)
MKNGSKTFNPALEKTIASLDMGSIPVARKAILQQLIDYLKQKFSKGETPCLVFICTHNSRRSQFAQIWAQVAAVYYGFDVKCFSGGVEVTAFNKTAVETLKKAGFDVKVENEEDNNPVYNIHFAEGIPVIKAFSKLFDDPANPDKGFAAVMTCSDADENCPFVPGCEIRIPLLYDDPKVFDSTPQEAEKYKERSIQIATEMFYVFSNIDYFSSISV